MKAPAHHELTRLTALAVATLARDPRQTFVAAWTAAEARLFAPLPACSGCVREIAASTRQLLLGTVQRVRLERENNALRARVVALETALRAATEGR